MSCKLYLADSSDDAITNCTATGAGEYADKPWDPANTLTTISCTARHIELAFCT